MKEPQKAAFAFDKFQITSFSFKEPQSVSEDQLTIGFSPSGTYYQETGIFIIVLKFIAGSKEQLDNNHDVITAELSANFRFEEKVLFEDIPTYFYRNSIAIVFPYLRAFISSLTLQANLKPFILPILNLNSLEQPLKDNTKVIMSAS